MSRPSPLDKLIEAQDQHLRLACKEEVRDLIRAAFLFGLFLGVGGTVAVVVLW